MRLAGAAETRRVFVSLVAAAALHGTLFVAIDRLSTPADGNRTSGRDALRVEVTFARPAVSRHTLSDDRESANVARERSATPSEIPAPPEPPPAAAATDVLPPEVPRASARSENDPPESAPPPSVPTAAEPSSFTYDANDLPQRNAVPGDLADRSSEDRSARNTSSAADAFSTIEPERYVEPRYPEAAQRAGLEGTVALRLSVDGRGHVVSANITESSGIQALDTEAIRAARLWRFPRGEDDRESVHRIRFSLEER